MRAGIVVLRCMLGISLGIDCFYNLGRNSGCLLMGVIDCFSLILRMWECSVNDVM